MLAWRASRLWLALGTAGNAVIVAVYVASRTIGLPFGPDRPVRRRSGRAAAVTLAAVPALVIAATTAVLTPGWAGPEGPAGMAASMASTRGPASAAASDQAGMGDMG